MAVESGIGERFYLDGVDFSGNVGQLRTMGAEVGQQDTTNIQQQAMDRTPTLRGSALDWQSFFDDDGDSGSGPHDVLSAMSTADKNAVWLHRNARDAAGYGWITKQTSHAQDVRDGQLVVDIATVANGFGIDGGRALTDGAENLTGAANLTGVDGGAGAAAVSFGLQAFLHVTSFTGTSAAITIEDSDDNGTDPWALVTGASFTSVTGVTSERIATSRTENVKRWTRVAVTGTFSDLTIVVLMCRNFVTVEF